MIFTILQQRYLCTVEDDVMMIYQFYEPLQWNKTKRCIQIYPKWNPWSGI